MVDLSVYLINVVKNLLTKKFHVGQNGEHSKQPEIIIKVDFFARFLAFFI